MKDGKMKKTLKTFLMLTIMMAIAPPANTSSPQQCKDSLARVIKQLNIEGTQGKHFWELTDQQILDFKKQAKAKGLWNQFSHVCNSESKEFCTSCACDRRDFTNAEKCSLKCGCCWGNDSCR